MRKRENVNLLSVKLTIDNFSHTIIIAGCWLALGIVFCERLLRANIQLRLIEPIYHYSFPLRPAAGRVALSFVNIRCISFIFMDLFIEIQIACSTFGARERNRNA